MVSAPAHTDNITTDQQYAFNFGSSGSASLAGELPGPARAEHSERPLGRSPCPHLQLSRSPTSRPPGDQFTFYDNGSLLGTTSTPAFGSYVGECISCALADPEFSRGYFALSEGKNAITGVFDTGSGFGDGDFAVGVPEPLSWAMMLIGLAGLGAAFRSRRAFGRAATAYRRLRAAATVQGPVGEL